MVDNKGVRNLFRLRVTLMALHHPYYTSPEPTMSYDDLALGGLAFIGADEALHGEVTILGGFDLSQ